MDACCGLKGFLFGGESMKSPLPVLMQKYLAICIKKSIYVNTFYCIIVIPYMHISSWI